MDRARFTGPDGAIDISEIPFSKQSLVADDDEPSAKNGAQSLTYLKCGLVTRANGSGYLECDSLKIMVAVFGPRQRAGKREAFSEQARLAVEFKYATFAGHEPSTGRGQFQPSDKDRQIAKLIEEALSACVMLEKYPKSVIDVFITVLEVEPLGTASILSAAINCSSLALADAGIEMLDICSSATVTIPAISSKDKDQRSVMTVASMSSPFKSEQVVHLQQSGRDLNESEFDELLAKTLQGSKQMNTVIAACLTETVKRQLKRKK